MKIPQIPLSHLLDTNLPSDQVGSLKEELEKECMYVEYLERLLNDIELRR